MKFTILGGSGFIGRHLGHHLRQHGHQVDAPSRAQLPEIEGNAGHVIYCIGMTGDFRRRPYDTIDAHVNVLADVLRRMKFESFLYMSSTRVYSPTSGQVSTREDEPLAVLPSADGIYDLSKLLGESLCFAHPSPGVRVVRLSNVYGRGLGLSLFLASVMDSLVREGSVVFGETRDSSKDYVAVEDVVGLIERIALGGRHRRYNVASGRQTTHGELADLIAADGRYSCSFAPGGARRVFPLIDISRVREEFGFTPRSVIDDFIPMLDQAAADRAAHG